MRGIKMAKHSHELRIEEHFNQYDPLTFVARHPDYK